MAIGHTDAVTAGFGTFGLPNDYYNGVVGNIGSLISIGDTSNNFSRNINQERYDDILLPCQVIDDKIVDDYLEPMNSKKQEIRQLGHGGTWVSAAATFTTPAAAVAAIAPIYQNSYTTNDDQACTVLGFGLTVFPFVGSVTGAEGAAVSQLIVVGDPENNIPPVYATGTVSISTVSSAQLVVQNTTNTFITGGGSDTGEGLGDLTIGGSAVTQPVVSVLYTGLTKIREDVTMVTFYPNLEPSDDSEDNPWADDTYPLLDNSTDGVGYGQTFFKNAIDTGAGGNPTISGATDYGKVYTFNTTTASGVNTSIDTLDSEIVTLRTGMTTYMDGANVLKPIKIGYAVNIWSYDRGNNITVTKNNEYQTAIDVLNDPSIGGPY